MINCDLATQTEEQLLSTQDCDCDSHEVADNRDECQHCGAGPAQLCDERCPVGELDGRVEYWRSRRTEW